MLSYSLLLANAFMLQCTIHHLADLSFGQRQVEQFICDCPDAGEIVQHEPILRQALIWRFAGQETGYRIHWDNSEPTGPDTAEHCGPHDGHPSVIHVSEKHDAIDKCFALLFELNNFEVDREYDRLRHATPDERLSRDYFAISCVRHEFDALKQTRLFFKQHSICEPNSKSGPYYNSIMSSNLADFTKYLAMQYAIHEPYNSLEYFSEAYDEEMAELKWNARKK